jgi:hypothetical protein
MSVMLEPTSPQERLSVAMTLRWVTVGCGVSVTCRAKIHRFGTEVTVPGRLSMTEASRNPFGHRQTVIVRDTPRDPYTSASPCIPALPYHTCNGSKAECVPRFSSAPKPHDARSSREWRWRRFALTRRSGTGWWHLWTISSYMGTPIIAHIRLVRPRLPASG